LALWAIEESFMTAVRLLKIPSVSSTLCGLPRIFIFFCLLSKKESTALLSAPDNTEAQSKEAEYKTADYDPNFVT
jgi:hypothetical protein